MLELRPATQIDRGLHDGPTDAATTVRFQHMDLLDQSDFAAGHDRGASDNLSIDQRNQCLVARFVQPQNRHISKIRMHRHRRLARERFVQTHHTAGGNDTEGIVTRFGRVIESKKIEGEFAPTA